MDGCVPDQVGCSMGMWRRPCRPLALLRRMMKFSASSSAAASRCQLPHQWLQCCARNMLKSLQCPGALDSCAAFLAKTSCMPISGMQVHR